ncbi:MAG: hypothetical protein A4E32_00566 [Methanomassiliicoccales archaeon PtaU1.Bin124]|nr:MAG: hypothetical protein A4E32_00566 [Methanomassiliicoccales archaeon PtaU1.Bin124]
MFCPHCGKELEQTSSAAAIVVDEKDRWENRKGEDLEKALAGFVIMQEGEKLIQVWDGGISEIAPNGSINTNGIIAVLTNHRLLIVEMHGWPERRYELSRSIDLEGIKGIQIHDALARTRIIISHGSNGSSTETELYNLTIHRKVVNSGSISFVATNKTIEVAEAFRKLVVTANRVRTEDIKKNSQMSVVFDFGQLASQLAKGGIVVQVVRCPACNANMNMPTTGDTVTCQYCHTTSTAVDLFKKLRESITEVRK